VPYEKGYDQIANKELMAQAEKISKNLKADKIETAPNKEIIAMIAYLQRIGVDIKGSQPVTAKQ
jgi:cytochrome c oxidase cbb3-type subunit I/II